MRPSRRHLLSLLGVPIVGSLVAHLAPAEAAAAPGGEVRRKMSDPLGEPWGAHVIATVVPSGDAQRLRGEINQAVGEIEFYIQGEIFFKYPVHYLMQWERPGFVRILPTVALAMIQFAPGQHVEDISVRHTGLLAGVAEPHYITTLLTR